ncbi:MAG: CCA tRNA nucleotidyltransferase [Actinobacteria bacterium]|nr:CCA tRNA nucleotidyltransferase [Actinomycetota bacterium]
MSKAVEEYVAGLDLDAYLVGGAVRDELLGLESKDADFLVPRVDIATLRERLEPHGRTEELVVAGRAVGVRFHPRVRELRELVPAGIELAPPRREVSTGPGRHDFDIVVDPEATVEEDLGRRDFTVNALARRLSDDTLVDPFDGRADVEARRLRTVHPGSFGEDPLRLVRGLRFVAQLGFDPDEETVAQMREWADSVQLVAGERIGGGLASDGMGELSKLLLGEQPAKALRLARDTGVLVAMLPEYGPAIGFDPHSGDHDMTLDEHIFAVVQAAADACRPLRVRLATLFHDLGKPGGASDHAAAGAEIADASMHRLRYPNDLRTRVVRIVRFHPFMLERGDAVEARRLLAEHGEGLVLDLLDHWEADLRGRDDTPSVRAKLQSVDDFRRVVAQERTSPHRLSDLAVDGTDLIELGYRPGPDLGRALDELLDAVIGDPELNRRDALLARARERLVG